MLETSKSNYLKSLDQKENSEGIQDYCREMLEIEIETHNSQFKQFEKIKEKFSEIQEQHTSETAILVRKTVVGVVEGYVSSSKTSHEQISPSLKRLLEETANESSTPNAPTASTTRPSEKQREESKSKEGDLDEDDVQEGEEGQEYQDTPSEGVVDTPNDSRLLSEIEESECLSEIVASEWIEYLNKEHIALVRDEVEELPSQIMLDQGETINNTNNQTISNTHSNYTGQKSNPELRIGLTPELPIKQRYAHFLKICKEEQVQTQIVNESKNPKNIFSKIFKVKGLDEAVLNLKKSQAIQQSIFTLITGGSIPRRSFRELFSILKQFKYSKHPPFVLEKMTRDPVSHNFNPQGIKLLWSVMLNNAIFTQDWINISRLIIATQMIETSLRENEEIEPLSVVATFKNHPIFKLVQFWEGAIYFIIQFTK